MKKQAVGKYGYTASEYRRFSSNAYTFLIIYSLAYMTLYACRLNLANASAAIISETGLSSSKIGILTSCLFWTYGIGQLISGRLSEKVGHKLLICLAFILSSLANILMGFQSSLIVMAIIWGFNGLFQSFAWAPGISGLSKWFPSDKRGFATGFIYAFSGFGQAFAILSVTMSFKIIPSLGWRSAFFFAPVFPVIFCILFAVSAKSSPESIGLPPYTDEIAHSDKISDDTSEKGFFYPYKLLFSNGRFLVWLLMSVLIGLVRYGLTTWIPLYFTTKFDIDITSGLLQSLALPVGMGIGSLVVPSLTDRFCPTNRLPAVLISSVLAAVSVFAFTLFSPRTTSGLIMIEILLFLSGIFVYAASGTIHTFASEVGGRSLSGTSAGIINFGIYIGAAVQSIMYGFIQEKVGWTAVFVSVSAICLVITLLGPVTLIKKKK